ncbi:ferredoxin--NADP reductase [Candidatus Nitrospira allomarina]|uniref:FAD-dependent oxidoreductase n=1 Tax=Candidatus Nitrospira allomarina TaxID=3020900 RepID=A0AA96GCE7_9BACT|nr:FAD-dependent oxidoreductase [Candidatus Nitrospira allomarina]WNM58462.1 FAD-dependent oxidoreductase [Candidatus Nitrospira allomarina]
MGKLTKPSSYHVALRKRQEIAKGTMAFYFDRPAGFTFTAGQFIDLSLPKLSASDLEGQIRALTLASAPSEQQLMVATRLRDTPFKRMLAKMPLGTTVDLEGPFGQFTLPSDDSRTIVLLAGGIGITPFRSMLVESAHHKFSHHFILLYSNRHQEDAAFLDELQTLQQENTHFRCVGTMTSPNGGTETWEGETGRIDPVMLRKYVKEAKAALYYVVGPPAMVDGLRRMLESIDIPKTNIRSEEFVGY